MGEQLQLTTGEQLTKGEQLTMGKQSIQIHIISNAVITLSTGTDRPEQMVYTHSAASYLGVHYLLRPDPGVHGLLRLFATQSSIIRYINR